MYQQQTTGSNGNYKPYEGNDISLDNSYDFGELKVDVILGDKTRYTLDFAESRYLWQLPSNGKPVTLPFGSSEAIRKLNKIVALLRNTRRVRCVDYAEIGAHTERTRRRVGMDISTAAAKAVSGIIPSYTHVSVNDWDSALRDCVSQLTENRKDFMNVLELAACLEMEKTFPLLCLEFSRIFEEEVRGAFTSGLLSLAQEAEFRIQEVDRFRKIVIKAFALDITTPLLSPQQNDPGFEFYNTDTIAYQLRKQLPNDGYLYPEAPYSNDLTQSVDWETSLNCYNKSMDKKFISNFKKHPFQNPTWEEDDVRGICPVCGKTFAKVQLPLFDTVRASHCRCCGRRICKNCTSWKLDKTIAKLSKPGSPEEGRLRHACRECYNKAEYLNKNAFLCEIFVRAGLALTEIALLRYVNPQWKGAAELCLSDYRSLLYQSASWKLSITTQTARILANSVNILAGHPESLIFLFISMDWNDHLLIAAAYNVLKKTVTDAETQQGEIPVEHNTSYWKPVVSHWHMLCTRSCSLMLPSFFAIKILECLNRAPKGNPIAESMRTLVTEKLLLEKVFSLNSHVCECVTVFLLDIFEMQTCQAHATSVLLKLSERDQRLALMICQEATVRRERDDLSYRTLWEFVVKTNNMRRPDTHQEFLNTLRFLGVLVSAWKANVSHLDVSEARQIFLEKLNEAKLVDTHVNKGGEEVARSGVALKPMLFPFDTNIVVTRVDVDGMETKNSRQRPILIPLIDIHNNIRHILFKRECLEKDKVMCIASRFLQWALYKQLQQVELPTYHVMPLSLYCGIIEIVEDGKTIQQVIDECNEHRLLQHLMQLEQQQQQQQQEEEEKEQQWKKRNMKKSKKRWNEGLKVKVRESFLYSAKFFILINYIFAIADRHRDNVVVHPSGAIFHIDFGMILTTRTLVEQVTTGYVRFDSDLEECILKFMRDNTEQYQYQYNQQQGKRKEKEGLEEEKTTTLPSDLLHTFLMETADWFLEIRPYAGILCQLLSHVVYQQALDDVYSVEHLASLMQRLFMRDAAEETCKKLFCDRVKMSKGQTWLKDFTHDTHKRTWSIVSWGYNWLREKTGLDRSDVTNTCDPTINMSFFSRD